MHENERDDGSMPGFKKRVSLGTGIVNLLWVFWTGTAKCCQINIEWKKFKEQ